MREAGILLPIFSLPSHYGIGTLGKSAYEFIDFLADARQSLWQVLPIGPTGFGDSPYQSFSTFAGNPFFIDLDLLIEEGLLSKNEVGGITFCKTNEYVDYELINANRYKILKLAADRVNRDDPKFTAFIKENAYWLNDYALFMAIKEQQDNKPFWLWYKRLLLRNVNFIEELLPALVEKIYFWYTLSFFFFTQWHKLKHYANKKDIKIIGDIPIYVAADSADAWADQKLFQMKEGVPLSVAGCPPDDFCSSGQLWGNPLYDWEYHSKTNFNWWLKRLSYAGKLFDVVRIDHFRGFADYYSIPYGEETAQKGVWEKGPGKSFIDAIKNNLPALQIIAEDLGLLNEHVRELLRYSGFPGMKVLQFAFEQSGQSAYLPHNHIKNCVVYTGTHDNTTTAHWQRINNPLEIDYARRYLNISEDKDLCEGLIRAALSSVADKAIIPMQDYLGLGSEGRINRPGEIGGNWRWRVNKADLSDKTAAKIGYLTKLYSR